MARAIVIDGTPGSPSSTIPEFRLAAVRTNLRTALTARGADVEFYAPGAARLAHCIGCFACWVETPGTCRYNDGIPELFRKIVAADILVLLTPLTFGGYSATIKQVLDRMLGLVLPDFVLAGGELSHPPRYSPVPRLIGIGLSAEVDDAQASIFRALVGRTARNLHASGHASAVVALVEPELQRAAIDAALARHEPIPTLDAIARLVPKPTAAASPTRPVEPGQALLIVGSPRRLQASTSSVLGRRLLDGLESRGWSSQTVTVTSEIRREPARASLVEAIAAADLVVLAFGLYFDTLPYLLTRALEIVAARADALPRTPPRRLAAIVNSSFPQSAQSSIALGIVAQFAAATGMTWGGGIGIGAGAWIDGRPLSGVGRSRLPTGQLARALDMAAESLARREPIPEEALRSAARAPVPGLPFGVWQRAYGLVTGWELGRMAAAAGIPRSALRTRPYSSYRARPVRPPPALRPGRRDHAPRGRSAMTSEPIVSPGGHEGRYIHQNVIMRRLLNPIAVRLPFFTVLYVRGRRTGKRLAVPMDPPFEWEGKRYLVAPFGDCHWARNVRAAGEGELRRHGRFERFRAIELHGPEHDAILAAYDRLTDDTCRAYLHKLPDPADHPVFRIEPVTDTDRSHDVA